MKRQLLISGKTNKKNITNLSSAGVPTVKALAHLCRMDFSTRTLWTGPFQVKGMSGHFLLLPCFIEIQVFNKVCGMRRLIRVYIECQYPFYWTLGINKFIEVHAENGTSQNIQTDSKIFNFNRNGYLSGIATLTESFYLPSEK